MTKVFGNYFMIIKKERCVLWAGGPWVIWNVGKGTKRKKEGRQKRRGKS
jgi:hypothetical protein